MGGYNLDVEKILKLQEQGMGKSKIASMIYGTKGAYKKKLDSFMQRNGYISIEGNYVKENVEGIQLEYAEHEENTKENIPVEYKENINGIHQKEDLDKVNRLSLEYKKRIDKMLEWFENKSNVEFEAAVTVTDLIEVGLKIDDKIKDGEFIKMSSYINKEMWNEFKDFMKEYKEIGNKYILSQAMKEYMRKYKK